jgi:hypothetical protein
LSHALDAAFSSLAMTSSHMLPPGSYDLKEKRINQEQTSETTANVPAIYCSIFPRRASGNQYVSSH